MNENEILKALGEVTHPAKGDKTIVELGMVDSIECVDNGVKVVLGFPKFRDPLAEYLIGGAKAALIRNFGPDVKVEVSGKVKEEAPAKKKHGLELGLE